MLLIHLARFGSPWTPQTSDYSAGPVRKLLPTILHTVAVGSSPRFTSYLFTEHHRSCTPDPPGFSAPFSFRVHRIKVALFPGLPHFCSLLCVQYNTWKWKSGKT